MIKLQMWPRAFSLIANALVLGTIISTFNMPMHALEQPDPIVFKRSTLELIHSYRFKDAAALMKQAANALDPDVKATSQLIQSHYMPKVMPTIEAEKILQQAFEKRYSLTDRFCLKNSQNIVKRFPQLACAHMLLSSAYWWELNDSLAMKEAAEAVRLAPANVDVLTNFAKCSIYAHRDNDAMKYFKQVQQIDPKNDEACAFFDTLQVNDGNIDSMRVDRKLLKKQMLAN